MIKLILKIGLFVFLGASLLYILWNPVERDKKNLVETRQKIENGIVVYYFHGTQRCSACETIQELTSRALHRHFEKDLRDQRIFYLPVNLDQPWNEHYIMDFKLSTKTVVLVRYLDGAQTEWKVLDDVWFLYEDEPKFIEFIRDELNSFIAGGSV